MPLIAICSCLATPVLAQETENDTTPEFEPNFAAEDTGDDGGATKATPVRSQPAPATPASSQPVASSRSRYRPSHAAPAPNIGPADTPDDFKGEPVEVKRILHGFRLGYVFVSNHDKPGTAGGPNDDPSLNPSLEQDAGMRSPHQFLIGYELTARLVGHEWLNVLLIGNVSVIGLQESNFFPSANGLIGFELQESFQAGVGIHLVPAEYKAAHMIVAAGWTPRVGSLHVPFHVFFIPDIDKAHKLGITLGVNWE